MTPENEKRVLVLQGGGALGAYQAGAYEALAAAGQEPEWVAGISIGAINAALIAGNRPENRVKRLREFWKKVSSGLQGSSFLPGHHGRSLFNETSSWLATLFGVPGFFTPRFPPPIFATPATEAALSFYDTAPLRATLAELIDFERLNKDGVRVSVGAVNVESGNFRFFDTLKDKLNANHFMASGALPPGFPPVVIEGQSYWDGGLVSNTPLQYVIDEARGEKNLCIFQVDLFPARGAIPKTILEAAEREKEIRFSSRTRFNTTAAQNMQRFSKAAQRLAAKLPDSLRDDPDAKILLENSCGVAVTVMHLINRPTELDSQSKDYEFSRLSVEEHWEAGRKDVEHSLAHPDWRNRETPHHGMKTFDLTRK
ncbi:MAG TPA: patatin-like phospholipase family protein [Aestuariivirga sp.]